jgi:sulfite reductase (NADPH) flavoprotein alpha-component
MGDGRFAMSSRSHVQMTVSEYSAPNLTEAQRQQIKGLATSLDPKQLLWVSGFFAGLEYGRRADPMTSDGATALAPEAGRLPATRTLTVLYGSETGHSTAVAASLAERAKLQGLSAQLFDMAAFKPRQLKELQDVLIVVSTYGEGDPPQPAVRFFEFVEGRKAPKLPDVRFAVLALGDSTYEHYCEAGKRLDRRFEELGATRLKPRVDCDVDYDEPAEAWIADVLSSFDAERSRTAEPALARQLAAPSLTGRAAFDKRKILRVIDSLQLTDAQKVSTPVNWERGQPVIISPSLSNEAAKERFPQGWTELKPYLRLVQLPD